MGWRLRATTQIGLRADQVKVLGVLPPYLSAHGLRVHPVLALVGQAGGQAQAGGQGHAGGQAGAFESRPNPDEVEAVSEHVLDTLGARGATVHDVRRLENLGAYARYAEARRHAIASRSLEARSRTLLETVMFHGCVGLESEDAICRAGLDTACCRSGGRGHGTWLNLGDFCFFLICYCIFSVFRGYIIPK